MSATRSKHFISLHDHSTEELLRIIDLAHEMKRNPAAYRTALHGQTLGMIFHKKSTRTRVSFEVGIFQLGGVGLYFGPDDLQLSRGEPISDTARVLSRYLDGLMIRTFAHQDVLTLAEHSSIPVINGLTDFCHPCQVMADLMTIQERFKGFAEKIAYVGDGNNMAHSLLFGAAKVGMSIAIVSPKDYFPDPKVVETAKADRVNSSAEILITDDIKRGLSGANVVYTDVWASMGQEAESAKRKRDFAGFTVDTKMMTLAAPKALFMHCLPAHRGEEVASDVIDGPQSIIFDQAENRLHVQKAILYHLMRRH